jgi:hypothetical protein
MPLYEKVQFLWGRKNLPKEDVSMVFAELATKMTYPRHHKRREKQFLKHTPHSAPSIEEFWSTARIFKSHLQEKIENSFLEVALADGTKTHSQEPHKSKNQVNVTLGMNNGRKILLHVQCQPTPGKTLLTNSRRTRYSLKKRLS